MQFLRTVSRHCNAKMGLVIHTGFVVRETHLHHRRTHPTARRPSITRACIGSTAASSTVGAGCASGCVSGSIVGDASPTPFMSFCVFPRRLAISSRHSVSEEEKPPEPAPESVAAVAASVAGEEKPPEPESQKVKKGDRQARPVAEFRTEDEQCGQKSAL